MAQTGTVAPQFRLFVGHLPLLTTDQDFQAAFSGSKYTLAQVITRGRRPLGHGFVDFATAEDLNAAVSKYQNFQILGQDVKVEIARPREERPPRQQQQNNTNDGQHNNQDGNNQDGGRRRGRRNQNNDNSGNQAFGNQAFNNQNFQQQNNNNFVANNNNNQDGLQNGGGRRRRNRNRTNGQQNGQGFDGSQGNGFNNNQGNQFQNNQQGNFNQQNNNNQDDGPARPRRQRDPRPPREPRETVLSTTTVYVTNLPFSYTDNDLFSLFQQHTQNPKSARINQRKQGNKSRGVGFVEYENQAGQQEAIAKLAGFLVPDGEKPPRKINVVVSQTHPNPNANQNEGGNAQ